MSGGPAVTQKQLERVLDALMAFDGPVKLPELVARCHIHDRTVREGLRQLALRGFPIVTDPSFGVEFCRDPEKLDASAEQLQSRSRAMFERSAALHRTARLLRSGVTIEQLRLQFDPGCVVDLEGRQDLKDNYNYPGGKVEKSPLPTSPVEVVGEARQC